MNKKVVFVLFIGVLAVAAAFFLLQSGGIISAGKTVDGVKIVEMSAGEGGAAKLGDRVTVHYRGMLENGKEFDASYGRNQPFRFELGKKTVIEGWDIGVVGMKVGEKRKLVIPPEKAYGEQNIGGGLIPPNSTLTFEVELLKIN